MSPKLPWWCIFPASVKRERKPDFVRNRCSHALVTQAYPRPPSSASSSGFKMATLTEMLAVTWAQMSLITARMPLENSLVLRAPVGCTFSRTGAYSTVQVRSKRHRHVVLQVAEWGPSEQQGAGRDAKLTASTVAMSDKDLCGALALQGLVGSWQRLSLAPMLAAF